MRFVGKLGGTLIKESLETLLLLGLRLLSMESRILRQQGFQSKSENPFFMPETGVIGQNCIKPQEPPREDNPNAHRNLTP